MQKYLSLSQIGLYNPQRLNDDLIERLFIVRHKVFIFLMDKIQEEKKGSIHNTTLSLHKGDGEIDITEKGGSRTKKAGEKQGIYTVTVSRGTIQPDQSGRTVAEFIGCTC